MRSFFVSLIFLAIPAFLMAQPGDPGGDPDGIPIDGGVSLLAAAGIGYGVKKLIDHRKKQ